MKAKRLVSFVATSAMLMSMAAPVLAATTEELGRLSGLGVITGYTAGGTDFKPEQTITRAEFAAVAVRLLGLDSAASAAKGSTKFKDVSASHWASGYINLAVGNGIIKGYPNGLFKPEGKVTYAESFAMLVRVLGYEPQVTGTWPTNYVGKASQIGLLDGLSTTDFNAAATRGNIFTAADNSLDIDVMKQTVFGADPEWAVSDKALIEDKLDYEKVKDVTIDKIPITTTSLDSNEVHIASSETGITGTYEVVGNFDVNGSIGLTGTAWINKTDDKIVLFQSDDKVEADQIKSMSTADNTITLKDKDDTYNVTADTKFYLNYNNVTETAVDDSINNLRAGEMVNVVLDGDDIQAVYAYDMDTDIVDRVDSSNDKIYVTEGSGTITLADNYTIVKDGKTIALADIKAGDVVQWNKESGDKYYVRVAAGTASGKLTSALATTTYNTTDETYKVTVGSTQYTTAIDAQYSTDAGDSYDAITDISDFSDVDGKDVTVYMNSFGKVAFIKAGDANASSANTVLLKEFTYSDGADGKNYYARVMKSDGTEAYYEVNDDTTLDNNDLEDAATLVGTHYTWSKDTTTGVDAGSELVPGTMIKLDLNSNGTTVDNFETFNGTETRTGLASKVEDNNTITVNGKTLQVQSDTKFFTVKNYDTVQGGPAIKDAKFITWADVKSTYNDTFGGAQLSAVFDGAKAQYVFINDDATVTSDMQVGVVDSKGINGSDKILNVFQDGAMKAIEYGWTAATDTGKLYTYELDSDNKATSLNVATASEVYTGSIKTYEVKDITEGLDKSKIITLRCWNPDTDVVGTTDYEIIVNEEQTTFIDITDDPKKVDGVAKGDHVTIYDLLDSDANYTTTPDGIIDYVVIEN